MKSTLLLFAFGLMPFLHSFAQGQVPQGKAIFLEFDNTNATFNVPEGKTWYVHSIYSDHLFGGSYKFDEYDKVNYFVNSREVRIFIKELNGKIKTDYVKNVYGPQVYRSHQSGSAIPFPMIFTEKTNFSMIALHGEPGDMKPHTGSCYISLVEVQN